MRGHVEKKGSPYQVPWPWTSSLQTVRINVCRLSCPVFLLRQPELTHVTGVLKDKSQKEKETCEKIWVYMRQLHVTQDHTQSACDISDTAPDILHGHPALPPLLGPGLELTWGAGMELTPAWHHADDIPIKLFRRHPPTSAPWSNQTASSLGHWLHCVYIWHPGIFKVPDTQYHINTVTFNFLNCF